MKTYYLSLFSFLLLSSPLSYAGTDYRCKIERIEKADGEHSNVLASERKQMIGKEFTVDRKSGIAIGALRNYFATKPVVIDGGSKDNSFKVVTTMRVDEGVGRGSALYALIVKEYEESPKKPFLFLSGDMVYFGSCVHF